MNDNYTSTAPTALLGGAKRKNGHKSNCSCHICDNMKNKAKRGGYQDDIEKAEIKLNGGSKKKNGHKANCSCPICKNMKNATSGKRRKGKGTRKSNGHKSNCGCPICKNMKKKTRKGGEEPDIEEGGIKSVETYDTDDKLDAAERGESGIKSVETYDTDDKLDAAERGEGGIKSVETNATDDEYDKLDAAERGEGGITGGKTRKRHGSRKSNGHKTKGKCSICKNMKKGKKSHRYRK
jgi:hypothetical protein